VLIMVGGNTTNTGGRKSDTVFVLSDIVIFMKVITSLHVTYLTYLRNFVRFLFWLCLNGSCFILFQESSLFILINAMFLSCIPDAESLFHSYLLCSCLRLYKLYI
jgi:hypothetical protein